MTQAQATAEDILDRLFDTLPPLAALRGYERDKLRDAAKREIEFVLDRDWPDDRDPELE